MNKRQRKKQLKNKFKKYIKRLSNSDTHDYPIIPTTVAEYIYRNINIEEICKAYGKG